MSNLKRNEQINQSDIGTRVVQLTESLGRIDLDNLHDELEEAGVVALWWGDFSARARRRANEMEFQAEIVKAQVSQKARKALLSKGEKETEDKVKELVRLDPEYQAAYRAYLQAEEDADRIESAKFTIARRQEIMKSIAPLLFAEEGARRAGREVLFPSIEIPLEVPRTPQRTPMPPRGGGR